MIESRKNGIDFNGSLYDSFQFAIPYRSISKQALKCINDTMLRYSSQGASGPFCRRPVDTPVAVYSALNFPHDHLNNSYFEDRLDVLYRTEKSVIANSSKLHTYRRDFYYHCFDSFVPLSDNGSKPFLNNNHNNVYLGVKRNTQGDCEGCALKKPIHMNNTWKRIRKFVGNREVFDIITNDNRILILFLSF